MVSLIERLPGECELEFHKRIVMGKLVDGTLADIDYSELSERVYGEAYSSDYARKMMYGSKFTLDIIERDNAKKCASSYDETREKCANECECSAKKSESSGGALDIALERKKLQAEKVEYNRILREAARDELIMDKIASAIQSLQPIEVPKCAQCIGDSQYGGDERVGVLMFGDEHYGSNFVLRGLNGEVINAYSIDIAESRMNDLLEQVSNIVERERLNEIHVMNMGDFTDGVLRVGQLKKLELGVVDSTVRYMEFISQWLNELTYRVNRVKFQMVHGNHSELRMLGQQKGTFKDENMGKIVAAYIKMRLKDNPNFEFIDNPAGLILDNVAGFTILGIHGEVKDMNRAIRDLSYTYKTNIDYLVAGHLHHGSFEASGSRCGVIRVPSIVGTDEYALSLGKVSDAGATLAVFERGVGKSIEYSIYL